MAIPCASIDLSGDVALTGDVFDDRRWFRVTHSQGPPEVCRMSRPVHVTGGVGVALSVYPTKLGHFVPEQLPNVLLLHAHLPPEVPIIVGDADVTRRYLSPLVRSGHAHRDRFRYMPLSSDGTVVHADTVYTVVNSHFSNVMNGDIGYRTARAAYNPGGPVPVERRNHIVLIERPRGRARWLSNSPAVRALLQAAASQYASRRHVAASTAAPELRVVTFEPNDFNVSADIEAFRHAAVVVAPHGAGLANLLFVAEGTPVVEICYDDASFMACPAMYAAMAANLHLPYWVVTAAGGYGTPMKADLRQLRSAFDEALQTVHAMRVPHRLNSNAEEAASRGAGQRGRKVDSTAAITAHVSGSGVSRVGWAMAATVRGLAQRCWARTATHAVPATEPAREEAVLAPQSRLDALKETLASALGQLGIAWG